MNTRRITFAIGAAAGGALAAALFPTAAATADTGSAADVFGFTLPSDADFVGEAGLPPFLQESATTFEDNGLFPFLENTGFEFDSADVADGVFADVDFGDGVETDDVAADVTNYSAFGIESQTISLNDAITDSDGDTVFGDGSVFNVTDLGLGFGNVYTDITAGNGTDSVHDTLVTPLGNVDLTSLFGDFDAADADSLSDVNPSDGLDVATDVTDIFGGLF